ncbi:pachytene checkpoint protein 2 homolog isoform X1 [Halyomorpha halys]|uniref:pachytene checkpoint protein 2 homolog isoform X1 n=2 Tax=Halyomorpha halys TaxID=286706 RepID=UPI0006D4FB95|nr:pachytene checkpoint protein 2 homolog isoform X1 [Halyomorpha halys]
MANNLNVEVIIKDQSVFKKKALIGYVKDELMRKTVLRIGSQITVFELEALQENVEVIFICELGRQHISELSGDGSTVNVSDVDLCIHIYRLNREGAIPDSIGCDDTETTAATHYMLPATSLHGLWESLIFDSNIKTDLLQYARSMLYLSKCGVNSQLISCNRVVLLHGPPGTGKTSLCKALAQKISVRMADIYPQAVLVEINSHGLFSKFFSESGKLVSRLFSKFAEMALDLRTLVFILVDEVESLAHSRASFTGNEPSDSIRVVNALLTHLDMLKEHCNVMILTTSNITGAIDIAFVDRADIKAFIPQPSPFAIYSIYHSCLQELLRVGIIIGTCPDIINDKKKFLDVQSETSNHIGIGNTEISLIELARESEGLTGRSLRKVPLRVLSTQLVPEKVVRIEEFITAMLTVVKQMKSEQNEINKNVK